MTATPLALAPYLKIETPDRGMVPLELYPSQVELIRLARRFRYVLGLKARQLGWTWGLALLGLHDCIAWPNGETGFFTLDQDEANKYVERVRKLYFSGPDWLHATFPVAVDNVDHFGIEHPDGVSSVEAFPASGSSGRSRTFRRAIGDERPFWKRKIGGPAAAQRWGSILPTVADGGSLIVVGTADGYDDHYEDWMGGADPEDPTAGDAAAVASGEVRFVRYFANALARPGRTMQWVMTERARLDRIEPGLGAQEYPLTPAEAFRASGQCIFDKDALEDLLTHSVRPPIDRCELRATKVGTVADPHVSGRWAVWEWPRSGRSYLIAADCSGGVGASDFSSAGVYDVQSWDQVATFHGRPEPRDFANELEMAGKLYAGPSGPALLAPEKNNHGEGVVAVLIERKYPRIYHQERFDQRLGEVRRSPGYTQTQHTRQVAVSALQAAVSDGSLGIRDHETLVEMSRFVDPGDGKPRAEEGGHDDRVLQTAIAAAVLSFSRSGRKATERKPQAPYKPRISAKTSY